MKIRITTKRLPNKFPEGDIYEVAELTGILASLVAQGEAEVVGLAPNEEPKEEPKKVVKKRVKKIKK